MRRSASQHSPLGDDVRGEGRAARASASRRRAERRGGGGDHRAAARTVSRRRGRRGRPAGGADPRRRRAVAGRDQLGAGWREAVVGLALDQTALLEIAEQIGQQTNVDPVAVELVVELLLGDQQPPRAIRVRISRSVWAGSMAAAVATAGSALIAVPGERGRTRRRQRARGVYGSGSTAGWLPSRSLRWMR